ncbi:MAG TPA: 4-hydroxy-tetrahydrodipicolinate reductase [Candidatus Latescibacteria bacterium]|nr:4-hydroxy-tetrahydrodipicolinate reductase [Candidatus Latescibacterota bacterium]
MIQVIVQGAAGRMGSCIARLVLEAEDLKLAGATERPGHPAVGRDVGEVLGVGKAGVEVGDNLRDVVKAGEVVVNFTTPEATVEAARICGERGRAMVVGTTGLSQEQLEAFRDAVTPIPCVFSPNFSVGVNVLFRIAEEVARILGPGYDVEIVEAHHRFKKDAPSGTAKRLAQAVAKGLGRDWEQAAVYGREGMVGERRPEEIGVHAIRAGDIVGEHIVLFGGMGERVELVHRASSREAFAQGALRAVRFVVGAEPGLYDMGDVLGLRSL